MELEILEDLILCILWSKKLIFSSHAFRSTPTRIKQPSKTGFLIQHYKMNAFFEFVLILMCLSAGNAQFEDRPPPHYSSDHLPETKFTCEGKFTGRYYADPDTDCQMFHICSKTSRRDVSDFKFLCPNGTVFDQVWFLSMKNLDVWLYHILFRIIKFVRITIK